MGCAPRQIRGQPRIHSDLDDHVGFAGAVAPAASVVASDETTINNCKTKEKTLDGFKVGCFSISVCNMQVLHTM